MGSAMELGPLVSWIAVVPSAVSAGVAIMNARRSNSAARDAEEALAATLRPELSPVLDGSVHDEVNLFFSNVARHDALDVRAEVHLSDGRKVGEGEHPRLPGQVPNTWAPEPEFKVTLRGLPSVDQVDHGYDLVAVLHFFDERRMRSYRQEIGISRALFGEPGNMYMKNRFETSLPTTMRS
ncbi:hypothetical protein [Amycolatopsis sp. NPDC051903]|uniref:hypothetical protein n=1 Tax=Amycolatopsis sp. NPDC051903 TaxID=3363936 RepID=UPI00378C07C0